MSVNSAFLDSKRADTSNTGLIVDRRHQRRDCYFEEVSMWHSELVNKITGLGSYLLHEDNENATVAATVGLSGTTNYTLTASGQSEIAPNIQTIQNDNQIIFPLVVIIEELEEVSSYMNSGIASVETGSKQKHWVVDMLKDLGYTYGVLAESYVLCLQRNDGKRIEVMQSLMASLLYILDQWIHVVETTPSTKASASPLLTIEHTELLQTIRSQSIRGWCDRMRHHMHILKGQHMSQACKTQLDSQLIALQSIEDRILHLIVI